MSRDIDLRFFAASQPVLSAVVGLRPEILCHFLTLLKLPTWSFHPYSLHGEPFLQHRDHLVKATYLVGSINALFSLARESFPIELRA